MSDFLRAKRVHVLPFRSFLKWATCNHVQLVLPMTTDQSALICISKIVLVQVFKHGRGVLGEQIFSFDFETYNAHMPRFSLYHNVPHHSIYKPFNN